jgi:hypothetical protein
VYRNGFIAELIGKIKIAVHAYTSAGTYLSLNAIIPNSIAQYGSEKNWYTF